MEQLKRLALLATCVWGGALMLSCTSEVAEGDAGELASECVHVSLHSDYVSTSVSLLRPDGTLCKEGLIDSGSAPLDVVAALSGDVSLPSGIDPKGRVVLIDRYPHAVISFVTPGAELEVAQIAVGTGFAANPHDMIFLDERRAYVTRFGSNGGAESADAMDAGGDVLIIDHEEMEIRGRIPLSAQEGFDPMPSQMAQVDGHVWVALSHLSRDFQAAGEGRVAGIDPESDSVVSMHSFEGLSNCGAVKADRGGTSLWVGCSGLFAVGEEMQRRSSALVYLRAESGVLTESWRIAADESIGSPVASSIASVAPGRALFKAFGSLQDDTPDRLLWADASTSTSRETGIEGSAYELGSLLYVADLGMLLMADADPTAPLVRRFELSADALMELPSTDASPSTGLAPRGLSRYR